MPKQPAFLLLLAAIAAHAAAPFTLEQAMSAPWPSELTASKRGNLAWVFNARGVRNIWVAEPPNYKARAITANKEDDGQELSDLSWTPDGGAIVYVRGEGANGEGGHPNPRHLAEAVEQQVWIVPVSGGKPRMIGEGNGPAIAPDGSGVAFLRKGQVWWAPLVVGGSAAGLFHAPGQCHSLRWSPDGKKLAFVSDRGDHSFIGEYAAIGLKILYYPQPSVNEDTDPAWSPDGSGIAFLRIPPSRGLTVFGPKRSSAPWSIQGESYRPSGGAVARSYFRGFRAAEGKGSVFHEIAEENQVMWAADDRIIFPWEPDGWTHLYSLPHQLDSLLPQRDVPPKLLTPGDFEVEDVALSLDRKQVIYSSNQGDIDRRHLWRVPVDGGKAPEPLTTGDGIEWGPVPAGDVIAFFRSDAQRPARVAIRTASGEIRDLAPETMPRDFPANAMVTPQPVIFPASDGLKIHGQLFLPRDMAKGVRHPAVIFFHGGSRRQMLLGWHYKQYYNNAYAMNQYLASRGYIVLSVNYRSGTGYGMEFREALNYGATGASEYNDVLGAGKYLRGRNDVDPKRIGLWGGSYGGYLTALGLARNSDLFAAGVDFHGVHDWRDETHVFVSTDDLDVQQKALRLALQSSPMADVDKWRSPVLLIHGDDDRNVAFNQTVRLAEALRAHKVEFEQLIFPDEIHEFLLYSDWLRSYQAAADFLDRKLAR
jgi:dipeptidyl aminopeptidase/acylaminoacyl peptidase